MKLTVKEIIIIADTLKCSLEDNSSFGFTDEEREKVLKHLIRISDDTCIVLEGDTGKNSKK